MRKITVIIFLFVFADKSVVRFLDCDAWGVRYCSTTNMSDLNLKADDDKSILCNSSYINGEKEGSELSLENYDPPASLYEAILDAEKKMDEIMSLPISSSEAIVVQVDDEDEPLLSPVPNSSFNNAIQEELTYSQVKRLAFSPLEVPQTVEKKNSIEDQCAASTVVDADDEDLLLQAFLPPNNDSPPKQSTATIPKPSNKVVQSKNSNNNRSNHLNNIKQQSQRTQPTSAANKKTSAATTKDSTSCDNTTSLERSSTRYSRTKQRSVNPTTSSTNTNTSTVRESLRSSPSSSPPSTSSPIAKTTNTTKTNIVELSSATVSKRREAMHKFKERTTRLAKKEQHPPTLPVTVRSLTKPISPKFTTNERLGKPKPPSVPIQKEKENSNHDSRSSSKSSSEPTKLTIPRPPKLSTLERNGEKIYSLTTNTRCKKPSHANSSATSSVGDTSSVEHSVTSSQKDSYLFMAETKSVIVMSQHFVNTLREPNDTNSPKSFQKRRRSTIPRTPMVLKRTTSTRKKVHDAPPTLSTKDREEMEYRAAHQFKARPMPRPVSSVSTTSLQQQLRTQKKSPSSLSNTNNNMSRQSRMSSSPPPLPPSSADELELAKQFKARPLPNYLVQRLFRTTTQPTTGTGLDSKNQEDPDLKSKPKIISFPRVPVQTKVPSIIRQRIERRQEMDSKRNTHKTTSSVARSSTGNIRNTQVPFTTTIPKPFVLESEIRGMNHQDNFQERIRHEEEHTKELARSFKAKPAPSRRHSSARPFTPGHSDAPLTEPRGFHLQTELRHELHQADLQSKIEAEAARRALELNNVKPLPVPKTLYKPGFKPVVPSELGRKPVRGSSPHLETSAQSKRRQSFDLEAKERRDKEEKIKQLMEKEEELEAELEIHDLRQLPASEGGFNPVVKPYMPLHARRRTGSSSTPNHLLSFR